MVDAGLSEMDAIIAGTRNAAENLGKIGSIGTIEKGTLIRRPSVKRKQKSFSVPEEPTVLSGLHPIMFSISGVFF